MGGCYLLSSAAENEALLRVSALHALLYCERLFYLEEVEEIRIADASVYAGRTLHEELAREEGEEQRSFFLSSEKIGLTGKVDAIRHRNGNWVVYEHKRGKPLLRKGEEPQAWESDIIQVTAYSLLLEEYLENELQEARIRYHGHNTTVIVPLTAENRDKVIAGIEKATELRSATSRPPVCESSKKCLRCSLAPICLPEEERFARSSEWEPIRLFPPEIEGAALHVTGHQARLGRSGDAFKLEEGENAVRKLPSADIHSITIHGNAQVSTQALHLCAGKGINLHWFSGGGTYLGSFSPGPTPVQRRIRQYQALTDPGLCLKLSRRTVRAKVESQLRFLLRSTRGGKRDKHMESGIGEIRSLLKTPSTAEGVDALRGIEGSAAQTYFDLLPSILNGDIQEDLIPSGRSRRPPKDRFNAILSFGYSMLYRTVFEAILAVGLEPALGYLHTPRSSAHPLVMDVIELFRVPVWDIVTVSSINRKQWNVESDFAVTKEKVWLSDEGRKKAIVLFERRMQDKWKHPVLDYSLSWQRTMELEVRLLEKEWTDTPGLFARSRIR
ncbi:MAG: type I-MYXAN CRISPR-associated endonuclease Cas1 [Anaerovoracaceae bacterium]